MCQQISGAFAGIRKTLCQRASSELWGKRGQCHLALNFHSNPRCILTFDPFGQYMSGWNNPASCCQDFMGQMRAARKLEFSSQNKLAQAVFPANITLTGPQVAPSPPERLIIICKFKGKAKECVSNMSSWGFRVKPKTSHGKNRILATKARPIQKV